MQSVYDGKIEETKFQLFENVQLLETPNKTTALVI